MRETAIISQRQSNGTAWYAATRTPHASTFTTILSLDNDVQVPASHEVRPERMARVQHMRGNLREPVDGGTISV